MYSKGKSQISLINTNMKVLMGGVDQIEMVKKMDQYEDCNNVAIDKNGMSS